LKIRVRCFTGMRQYAPEGEGDSKTELAEGTRVGQLLDQMGVPDDAQPFIAVNGRKTGHDETLHDGDDVVLFTPMEGG
jgi:molybdopterin converting factor small subunit